MLVSSILRKALRLSAAGLTQASSGSVVNMMNTDSQQIIMFVPMLHMAWTAPLIIGGCFSALGYYVGTGLLGGIGVLFLLIPFMFFIMMKITKLRSKQLESTDKRISLVNDALQGVRVIKAREDCSYS